MDRLLDFPYLEERFQERRQILNRHEQERQLGDALTRALREIETRTRGQDKNLENLAIFQI